MIISHRHRLIFIKTYKTAGTSIEVYLSQHVEAEATCTPIIPHVEPHQARHDQGRWNLWREWLAHPIPRRQSWHAWRRRERFYNHIPARVARCRVPKRVWNSYYKFCVERNPWDKTLSHFHMLNHRAGGTLTLDGYLHAGDYSLNYPQYTDESGALLVDRVLKYETLNEELAEVFAQVGIPFTGDLGVRAKSEYRTDRRAYQEIFTAEQRDRIATIFAQEIALHGYSYNAECGVRNVLNAECGMRSAESKTKD